MTNRTMNQFAEEWADLREEENVAEADYQKALVKHDALKTKRENIQKELHGAVGNNIPTKLFKTDSGIVLVQMRNGQSHVTLEKLQ